MDKDGFPSRESRDPAAPRPHDSPPTQLTVATSRARGAARIASSSAPETDEIAPAPRKDLPCRSVTCIASSSAFVLRRPLCACGGRGGRRGLVQCSRPRHGTARHEQTWKAERRSWVWLSGRRDPLRSTCRHGHGARERERASEPGTLLLAIRGFGAVDVHPPPEKKSLAVSYPGAQARLSEVKLDGPGYLRGSQP